MGWRLGTGRRRLHNIPSERPHDILILTISMADAKQKQLVWRGQATVENPSNSQKGDEKQTKQCVQKLFKSYAPKAK
jgi:hypothetical protein